MVRHAGRELALVSGGDRVDAYDTEDGSLAWTLDGFEGAFIVSPTPLAGGAIIGSGKSGVAFCLNRDSGEQLWLQRLQGGCWASSIACGDFVYFFGVDGAVEVYRAADKAEKVAENRLSEESRLYGAAADEGRLLLRFGRRLACIEQG